MFWFLTKRNALCQKDMNKNCNFFWRLFWKFALKNSMVIYLNNLIYFNFGIAALTANIVTVTGTSVSYAKDLNKLKYIYIYIWKIHYQKILSTTEKS